MLLSLNFPILEEIYKQTIMSTDWKQIMERIKIKVKMASGLSKKLPHSIERMTKYIGERALEVNEKERASTIEVMLNKRRSAVSTSVTVVTFL